MDQETLYRWVKAASDQHIQDFQKLLSFEMFSKITRLSGFTLRGFSDIYIDIVMSHKSSSQRHRYCQPNSKHYHISVVIPEVELDKWRIDLKNSMGNLSLASHSTWLTTHIFALLKVNSQREKIGNNSGRPSIMLSRQWHWAIVGKTSLIRLRMLLVYLSKRVLVLTTSILCPAHREALQLENTSVKRVSDIGVYPIKSSLQTFILQRIT